jgi:[acyl-carrier-protein] S-malonyltransferase
MAEAAEGMRAALEGVAFADPSVPLLANADARLLTTAAACRAELVDHLTTGVDWIAAVNAMTAAGVTSFAEVGPGRVLTGLVRRIAPVADVRSLDDPGSPGSLADPGDSGSPGSLADPDATDAPSDPA